METEFWFRWIWWCPTGNTGFLRKQSHKDGIPYPHWSVGPETPSQSIHCGVCAWLDLDPFKTAWFGCPPSPKEKSLFEKVRCLWPRCMMCHKHRTLRSEWCIVVPRKLHAQRKSLYKKGGIHPHTFTPIGTLLGSVYCGGFMFNSKSSASHVSCATVPFRTTLPTTRDLTGSTKWMNSGAVLKCHDHGPGLPFSFLPHCLPDFCSVSDSLPDSRPRILRDPRSTYVIWLVYHMPRWVPSQFYPYSYLISTSLHHRRTDGLTSYLILVLGYLLTHRPSHLGPSPI